MYPVQLMFSLFRFIYIWENLFAFSNKSLTYSRHK
jgi:hypothetical protein